MSKFVCAGCSYTTDRRFLYRQHCTSRKHLSQCGKTHMCACGKTYKHVQSLNRHRKTCSHSCPDKEASLTAVVKALVTENAEMRSLVTELSGKIGNTTINNQFNITMFLNNECGDAIDLADFVHKLNPSNKDLERSIEGGKAAGISNVIIRGLKTMDLHHRPIHCSDLRKRVLYVKDDGVWGKENKGTSKIKDAIQQVAKKQIQSIKGWESSHPDWRNTDAGQAEWCALVREVMSPAQNEDEERILKDIAEEVSLDGVVSAGGLP